MGVPLYSHSIMAFAAADVEWVLFQYLDRVEEKGTGRRLGGPAPQPGDASASVVMTKEFRDTLINILMRDTHGSYLCY